jgi:hypothetical protein
LEIVAGAERIEAWGTQESSNYRRLECARAA